MAAVSVLLFSTFERQEFTLRKTLATRAATDADLVAADERPDSRLR